MFYQEAGQYSEALLDYHQAIELEPLRADTYLHRGLTYLLMKDYLHAINDFNKAIDLDPIYTDCYRQRALAHFLDHSLEQALDDLEFADVIEDKISLTNIDLGLCCFTKGEYQRAIQYFDQFIEDHPQLSAGYQNRGAAQFQLGAMTDALKDFDQALFIARSDAQLYEMRGLTYLALSFFNEAEGDLLLSIQLNPNSVSAYLNLAAVYYSMRRWNESLMMNQKAHDLNSSQYTFTIYKNFALLYFLKGEPSEALNYSNQAILAADSDSQLYIVRGLCLHQLEKYQEAVHNYQLAIELGGGNANLYFNRGMASYQLGHFEEANIDFT